MIFCEFESFVHTQIFRNGISGVMSNRINGFIFSLGNLDVITNLEIFYGDKVARLGSNDIVARKTTKERGRGATLLRISGFITNGGRCYWAFGLLWILWIFTHTTIICWEFSRIELSTHFWNTKLNFSLSGRINFTNVVFPRAIWIRICVLFTPPFLIATKQCVRIRRFVFVIIIPIVLIVVVVVVISIVAITISVAVAVAVAITIAVPVRFAAWFTVPVSATSAAVSGVWSLGGHWSWDWCLCWRPCCWFRRWLRECWIRRWS
mmetsp:Transcript_19602/g.29083  ORF Transcript_19602/g.29083 Transcript_19602/m.29083 type:complete len:264 (-) Transcript_19602:1766-2557(-)